MSSSKPQSRGLSELDGLRIRNGRSASIPGNSLLPCESLAATGARLASRRNEFTDIAHLRRTMMKLTLGVTLPALLLSTFAAAPQSRGDTFGMLSPGNPDHEY